MRMERQTGMKLIVAFHNFANTPKNTLLTSDTYIHWKKNIPDRESKKVLLDRTRTPSCRSRILVNPLWDHRRGQRRYNAHVRAISVWSVPHIVVFRQKQRGRVGSSEHCPTEITNAITCKVHRAQSVSTHSSTVANHLCKIFICRGLLSSGKWRCVNG